MVVADAAASLVLGSSREFPGRLLFEIFSVSIYFMSLSSPVSGVLTSISSMNCYLEVCTRTSARTSDISQQMIAIFSRDLSFALTSTVIPTCISHLEVYSGCC